MIVKQRERESDKKREVFRSFLATIISLNTSPPEFLILEFIDKQLLGNLRKKYISFWDISIVKHWGNSVSTELDIFNSW